MAALEREAAANCPVDTHKPIVIPADPNIHSDTIKKAYKLLDGSIVFIGTLMVNADGAPRAYGPDDSGLDDVGNAGHPGNWWGLATDAPSCGPSGHPLVQTRNDPAPGFYVSTTTMTNPEVGSCGAQSKYVDSSAIPYIALPRAIALVNPAGKGPLAVVSRMNGAPQPAILTDQAPNYGIGEASTGSTHEIGAIDQPAYADALWLEDKRAPSH